MFDRYEIAPFFSCGGAPPRPPASDFVRDALSTTLPPTSLAPATYAALRNVSQMSRKSGIVRPARATWQPPCVPRNGLRLYLSDKPPGLIWPDGAVRLNMA